jgi:hypothetical protein
LSNQGLIEGMRKELAKDLGVRKKFKGVFSRIGKKAGFNGYSEETILLKNIRDADTNQLVADHIWFNFTRGFEKLVLTEGVVLEFEARIKEYEKGYVNPRFKINNSTSDYKLSHPTRLKTVHPTPEDLNKGQNKT